MGRHPGSSCCVSVCLCVPAQFLLSSTYDTTTITITITTAQ